MLWFGEQYLPAEIDRARAGLSPNTVTDLAGLPPAVIGVAEFDPLRDEGLVYAKSLADAGVEVVVRRYDGLIHGFFGFTQLSAAAAEATNDMIVLLRELLAS